MPLAASAIIVWMLSTLTGRELFAPSSVVLVSGIVYGFQQRLRASAAPMVTKVAVG